VQAKLGWGTSWCGLASVALLGACAPSPKTVANVTTGITGCPSESLVVFGYTKATRTWAAACGERVYVCSDGRGPARCTEQQPDTVDAEKVVRAKAIAPLSAPQRAWFVDQDISQGDWASFAQLVATVKAMNEAQLQSTNPALVYAAGSEQLGQAVLACSSTYPISFNVDKQGHVTVPSSKPCAIDVVNRRELDPLRARHSSSVVLVPGLYGIKPVARPVIATTAAPTLAPASESVEAATGPTSPALTPASPELDAAVRQWLDRGASGVVACTGKSPTALVVDVGAAAPQVSIRGLPAGAPEEGCVKSTLGAPPAFPAGSGQILHVVKSP
jgi:hypothetical protein